MREGFEHLLPGGRLDLDARARLDQRPPLPHGARRDGGLRVDCNLQLEHLSKLNMIGLLSHLANVALGNLTEETAQLSGELRDGAAQPVPVVVGEYEAADEHDD